MRWREEKGIGSPHKNGGALNESNISGSILIDSLFCFYLHCLFLLIIFFLNNILLTQHVCNKLLSLCPSILSLFVKKPPLPSSLPRPFLPLYQIYNLEPSFSQGTRNPLCHSRPFISLCTNANRILSIHKKLLLTVIFYDFDHIEFVSMSLPKEWMLWEVVNGESQLPLTCVTRE